MEKSKLALAKEREKLLVQALIFCRDCSYEMATKHKILGCNRIYHKAKGVLDSFSKIEKVVKREIRIKEKALETIERLSYFHDRFFRYSLKEKEVKNMDKLKTRLRNDLDL